jgi:hypothetical protein
MVMSLFKGGYKHALQHVYALTMFFAMMTER